MGALPTLALARSGARSPQEAQRSVAPRRRRGRPIAPPSPTTLFSGLSLAALLSGLPPTRSPPPRLGTRVEAART